MSLEEKNKQLVLDFMEALSRGDVDAVINAYAEDSGGHCSDNGRISGGHHLHGDCYDC